MKASEFDKWLTRAKDYLSKVQYRTGMAHHNRLVIDGLRQYLQQALDLLEKGQP